MAVLRYSSHSIHDAGATIQFDSQNILNKVFMRKNWLIYFFMPES